MPQIIKDYSKFNIFYDGNLIVKNLYEGRKCFLETEKGEFFPKDDIESALYFVCVSCESKRYISKTSGINYYTRKPNRTKYCNTCIKTAENNPFYGKTHTSNTKQKISENASKYVGENNPFYGKTHTNETRLKISESLQGKMMGELNPFYGKTHTQDVIETIRDKNIAFRRNMTEEDKMEESKKLSAAQKRLYMENPEKFIEDKKRAAYQSSKSQNKYKMNKVEMLVFEQMKNVGIAHYFTYSVILKRMQFDFGCKDKKILLEVQGDYWHGNPLLFNEDGSGGKRKLNMTQKAKKKKDIEKYKFALEKGYQIFYIWESEVRNGNYETIERIKNILLSLET